MSPSLNQGSTSALPRKVNSLDLEHRAWGTGDPPRAVQCCAVAQEVASRIARSKSHTHTIASVGFAVGLTVCPHLQAWGLQLRATYGVCNTSASMGFAVGLAVCPTVVLTCLLYTSPSPRD
eukprot:9719340-Alexandrium_andersonii.AAC.1